jgi:predicted nuclease of predicted toxin-antitoxin system
MRFLLDHDVPDDVRFLLNEIGHDVRLVRAVLSPEATDPQVLEHAGDCGALLITCNRDDFLRLAELKPHPGIIVLIRRRSRAAERAALFRLLERAGDSGLSGNINFA